MPRLFGEARPNVSSKDPRQQPNRRRGSALGEDHPLDAVGSPYPNAKGPKDPKYGVYMVSILGILVNGFGIIFGIWVLGPLGT